MSDNNNRNGKVIVGLGAAGVLTIAGWGYADIRSDIRDLRKETLAIGSIQADLRNLRAERDRGLSLRDKEVAEMRNRIERLEGRK